MELPIVPKSGESMLTAVEIINEMTATPPTIQTEAVTLQPQLPSIVQSSDQVTNKRNPSKRLSPTQNHQLVQRYRKFLYQYDYALNSTQFYTVSVTTKHRRPRSIRHRRRHESTTTSTSDSQLNEIQWDGNVAKLIVLAAVSQI